MRGSAAHNAWQTPASPSASATSAAVAVAVCGELIGGSLAAMLALTECHALTAGGIRAAVLGNPVVDWTALYPVAASQPAAPPTTTTWATGDGNRSAADKSPTNRTDGTVPVPKRPPPPKPPRAQPDSWTAFAADPLLPAAALLRARAALFAHPEQYFDPFASPLLFFRTPSSDVPPDEPDARTGVGSDFADADATASSGPVESSAGLGTSATSPATLVAFLRKRRARRRYPPTGSGLVLPRLRLDLGAECVLRDQGWEMVESLRRRGGVRKGGGGGDGVGFDGGSGGEGRLVERVRGRNDMGPGAGFGGDDGGYGEGGGVGVDSRDAAGERRVEGNEVEGVGLWGEEELVGAGMWIADAMRRGRDGKGAVSS